MSEPKSKCHGAKVIPLISWADTGTSDSKMGWYCGWCGKPCEVIQAKEAEG